MTSIRILQGLAAHLLVSWLFANAVSAGTTDYACTITHAYQLAEIGTLETSPEYAKGKTAPRQSFAISRETGAVAGKSSDLDTALAKSTTVVHRGDNENSFVAVADFGLSKSGTHAYRVIKIAEYIKGSEKPFVAIRDLDIVSGTCK
jgi:hypothetical protein